MNINKFINFNFHFSVWLAILGGIAAFNFPDFIIPDEDGMYGPLRNNLLIAIGYLVFSEIGLWYFCYLRGGHFEALFMAYTFLATGLGAKFYGEINDLPVSGVLTGTALYIAASHGWYYFANRDKANETTSQDF
ncbi:hypothetical protein [Methylomagnum sp.]